MNRPQWLQDDIKMIRQWASTRILAFGVICQSIGLIIAFVSPAMLYRDALGKYFMGFILAVIVCAIGAQFYRQKTLRVTQPEKAETMVTPDPKS